MSLQKNHARRHCCRYCYPCPEADQNPDHYTWPPQPRSCILGNQFPQLLHDGIGRGSVHPRVDLGHMASRTAGNGNAWIFRFHAVTVSVCALTSTAVSSLRMRTVLVKMTRMMTAEM